MTAQFETMLGDERQLSTCRALVPVVAAKPYEISESVPADAVFLAALIAARSQAETVRMKRRAAPGEAIARYRAGRALADAPALASIGSL